MLEAFRNHKRWLMFIATVFIVPSFVVTGIYSYNSMMTDDGAIAKVDDVSITPQDFDEAKRKRLDSMRQQLGEAFRPNMLDTAEGRSIVLDSIMNDRSLAGEVAKEHIMVTEETAIQMIKTFPAFQVDGKFSAEQYSNFLAGRGYSDQYFVELVRRDIAHSLLTEGVSRSVLVPKVMAERVMDLLTEARTVKVHAFAGSDYHKSVKVTDDEVKAYWESHKNEFNAPDEIDVEYVVLTPDLFKIGQPSEEDIVTFYEQNPNRFRAAEQRRASHILIDLSNGKEAALKLANELLEQVKADPTRFADLAKKHSADPGSARLGGDLDFFNQGVMVPAFDKAVFAAKKGEIVGPIETDFGYHVIYVTDVKGEDTRPLSEVRGQIIALYQEQQAQNTFATEAENFTNMVYEQSDSLEPVIKKYNLKPVLVKNVTRDGSNDPKLNLNVIDSLFGDESLREKRNTQAVEVAQNTLVSARVVNYRPAHTRSVDEVKDQIAARLLAQKALNLAQADGEKALAKAQAGDVNGLNFKNDMVVSRQKANPNTLDFINQVMRADVSKLPTYIGVVDKGDYLIVEISKSEKMPMNADAINASRNELARLYAPSDEVGYLSALRAKHGAVILHKDYQPQQ